MQTSCMSGAKEKRERKRKMHVGRNKHRSGYRLEAAHRELQRDPDDCERPDVDLAPDWSPDWSPDVVHAHCSWLCLF